MPIYELSKDAAGSGKDNERSRNINSLFPYLEETYKTIASITRYGGIWCSAGGSSQSVTLSVYDQLLDGDQLIKTSDTTTCKCYGSGPSVDNLAMTTFSDFTQAESNAAIAAWKNGTLTIKRFATVKSYTSSKHGSPTFRDGYYSDTISISGADVPFTNYRPKIEMFDVFRSSDGVIEHVESASIYASIKLGMTDISGLSDNPILRIYYAEGSDPTEGSSWIDIPDLLSEEMIGTQQNIQIPGDWNNGKDFYFLLYFSAGDEVADPRLDAAMRASVPLSVHDNNCGVAIGQHSTATEDNPKFESNWKIYPYKGIKGVTDYSESIQSAYGRWIDDKPTYRRTILFNVTSAATDCETDVIDDDFESLVEFHGYIVRGSDGKSFPLNFYRSSTNYVDTHYTNRNTMLVHAAWTGIAHITVFYTRTSDTPMHETAALIDADGNAIEDYNGNAITVAVETGTVRLAHTAEEVDKAIYRTEELYNVYKAGELNGYTPVRGVDYWTPADKTEIINAVLAALGGGSTVVFTVDTDGNADISGATFDVDADGNATVGCDLTVDADGNATI